MTVKELKDRLEGLDESLLVLFCYSDDEEHMLFELESVISAEPEYYDLMGHNAYFCNKEAVVKPLPPKSVIFD